MTHCIIALLGASFNREFSGGSAFQLLMPGGTIGKTATSFEKHQEKWHAPFIVLLADSSILIYDDELLSNGLGPGDIS